MRIVLLPFQHWHKAPVSPLAAIDRHDLFLQPLQAGILRQPLETFRVFRDAHFEVAIKLVGREAMRAAQKCSPRAVRARKFGDRLWLFRIVRVARKIRWNVELKLSVEETNCTSSRSLICGASSAA